MIKEIKEGLNNLLNDATLPKFIRELIILGAFIAITLVIMLFISFPEVMFGALGFYLMARVFIEILRRH